MGLGSQQTELYCPSKKQKEFMNVSEREREEMVRLRQARLCLYTGISAICFAMIAKRNHSKTLGLCVERVRSARPPKLEGSDRPTSAHAALAHRAQHPRGLLGGKFCGLPLDAGQQLSRSLGLPELDVEVGQRSPQHDHLHGCKVPPKHVRTRNQRREERLLLAADRRERPHDHRDVLGHGAVRLLPRPSHDLALKRGGRCALRGREAVARRPRRLLVPQAYPCPPQQPSSLRIRAAGEAPPEAAVGSNARARRAGREMLPALERAELIDARRQQRQARHAHPRRVLHTLTVHTNKKSLCKNNPA